MQTHIIAVTYKSLRLVRLDDLPQRTTDQEAEGRSFLVKHDGDDYFVLDACARTRMAIWPREGWKGSRCAAPPWGDFRCQDRYGHRSGAYPSQWQDNPL